MKFGRYVDDFLWNLVRKTRMERNIHCSNMVERTHEDRAQAKGLNKPTLFKQAATEINADVK